MRQVYVEVLERATGEIVERMGPMDEAKAERIERGVRINMNHADYKTRIVDTVRS